MAFGFTHRSGVKTIGRGKAQESGWAKAGQPGGTEPATTPGPQVFYLPRGRAGALAVGTKNTFIAP